MEAEKISPAIVRIKAYNSKVIFAGKMIFKRAEDAIIRKIPLEAVIYLANDDELGGGCSDGIFHLSFEHGIGATTEAAPHDPPK